MSPSDAGNAQIERVRETGLSLRFGYRSDREGHIPPLAGRLPHQSHLPAGPHFMERAQIYADLDALELLDTALQDDVPGWKLMAVELLDGLVAH